MEVEPKSRRKDGEHQLMFESVLEKVSEIASFLFESQIANFVVEQLFSKTGPRTSYAVVNS